MLSAASASTWAQQVTFSTTGIYGYSGDGCQDVCTISGDGNKSLKVLLSEAGITSSRKFDCVIIKLDNAKNKVEEGLAGINTYALDLADVKNLNSCNNIKNNYVSTVVLPSSVGKIDFNAIANIKSNFDLNKLNCVVAVEALEHDSIGIDAYINKPGYLANGLQYVRAFSNRYYSGDAANWYNDDSRHSGKGFCYDAQRVRKLRVSGYVFARDIKATWSDNLNAEGHLLPRVDDITYQDGYAFCPGKCTSPLAPSLSDPNVTYFTQRAGNGQGKGALLGAKVTHFDFEYAEFGEYKNGVFKYYPADMTLSELYYLGNDPSVQEIKLPTSSTQYVIPEGFIHDSKHIHYICIPCNYTEIQRFAFLSAANNAQTGDGGGINRYTTTAAKDGEQKGIMEGDVIDNGPKTMTLASTMKFVGRGAFSGYGGAAHIEDVYVLAEKAPICEFYAFDQKTYVGNDSHKQEHLIRKGNYVNPKNGMAMLHFPNTTDQREMLNYSDMTRKYRLYDETGKFDNIGNILVWPTQAQYNRSYNQALAGVTWWAWKENLDGKDNPEQSFAGGDIAHGESGWLAGSGDKNANHEAIFAMAAKNDGFSQQFIDLFNENPNRSDFFDGSESKGGFDMEESSAMLRWDGMMLAKSGADDESDRPLTYNWQLYGGWHQFTIAELYDFMLEIPNPDPDDIKYFHNFKRFNKNIWYTMCFPFNMTKIQLLNALGNPKTGEMPYLSTLAGVTRDETKLGITIHMSNNLLKKELIYEDVDEDGIRTVKCDLANRKYATYLDVEYGDSDIVVEANKPYFILPALPDEEIDEAAKMGDKYNRKAEVTPLVFNEVEEDESDNVVFPEATRVHALNASTTSYIDGSDKPVTSTENAFNYYFVGNYIPDQAMPINSYYLGLTKKKDGSWWSSFFRMTPEKNKKWTEFSAVVMAVVGDQSNVSNSKGYLFVEEERHSGKTYNYFWKANAYDDFVFFAETSGQTYAKSAFGIKVEDNYTTSIELPADFTGVDANKVYNLNGQFVGTDTSKMAKGIYILGGKKVVVK